MCVVWYVFDEYGKWLIRELTHVGRDGKGRLEWFTVNNREGKKEMSWRIEEVETV